MTRPYKSLPDKELHEKLYEAMVAERREANERRIRDAVARLNAVTAKPNFKGVMRKAALKR